MKNGRVQQLQLHHSRQDSRGPLFEMSRSSHESRKDSGGRALHPYGNKKHPDHPVNRHSFRVDRKRYWKIDINLKQEKHHDS